MAAAVSCIGLVNAALTVGQAQPGARLLARASRSGKNALTVLPWWYPGIADG